MHPDPEIGEKELVESFERGEWRSTGATAKDRARYADYAKATPSARSTVEDPAAGPYSKPPA